MIYYIDTSEMFFDDCSTYFINSKNDEFITCGKITIPIVDKDDSNFINTAKEKYCINFFLDEQDCSTEIYAVPYINIFAHFTTHTIISTNHITRLQEMVFFSSCTRILKYLLLLFTMYQLQRAPTIHSTV